MRDSCRLLGKSFLHEGDDVNTLRVSVIVPIFNRSSFLTECVRSIHNTAYPDLEVLLIDDGSSDGSWQLAQSLARDPTQRVIALHHPCRRHLGVAASRNLGIRHASGDYLAFLDTDDRYEPWRFDQCIDVLKSDPMLLGVYEPVKVVKTLFQLAEAGQVDTIGATLSVMVPSQSTIQIAEVDPFTWIRESDWWLMPGVTLRRTLFAHYGCFRPEFPVAEDTELWLRLAATGRVRCAQSDRSVAIVQRHGAGHSWQKISDLRGRRLYRCALWSAMTAVRRRPDRYQVNAYREMKDRYVKAIEDDVSYMAECGAKMALLRLLVEVFLQAPRCLLRRRLQGDALRCIRG